MLKAVYDPRKLFGVTTLDMYRVGNLCDRCRHHSRCFDMFDEVVKAKDEWVFAVLTK